MPEPLIFEISSPGRVAYSLPELDVPVESPLPESQLRGDLDLPEVHELDVVRHFTHLSKLNYSVDAGFYPLGSCTMKYNPKVNEDVARLTGFARIHPNQDPETVQGALKLMYELQKCLAEISGLDAVTLQPAAGAQGELTGMMMIKAYHLQRGDRKRTKVLVPESAHGTNPATAAMCGFEAVPVAAESCGTVDLAALKTVATEETAALMLTNPNTLGLFEDKVCEITDIVHQAGGLVYGDGANLNAILGVVKPAQLGFDAFHFNIHKTFSTPHGGGGPGAGPVGVKNILAPFLPGPLMVKRMVEDPEQGGTASEVYSLFTPPKSIGRVRSFYGNFGVLVRGYNYIRMLGPDGLREVSTNAVLAANYLRSQIEDYYDESCPRTCMHEFVLSGARQKKLGVRTLDIAKRLIDYGFHPPTIYFPLIVEEALMIEPTETESIETLDAFAEAMRRIAKETEEDPEIVHSAPHHTPVGRLDEVGAARNPRLRYRRPTTP